MILIVPVGKKSATIKRIFILEFQVEYFHVMIVLTIR